MLKRDKSFYSDLSFRSVGFFLLLRTHSSKCAWVKIFANTNFTKKDDICNEKICIIQHMICFKQV